jgi:hypothetical protein
MLQNALDQTPGMDSHNAHDWQALIRARIISLGKFRSVIDDVLPFLERPQDAELLTRDNLLELLGPTMGSKEKTVKTTV